MIFKRTFEEMCFTVQLSMFVLFSLYLSDFCILSHRLYLVKNFLNFFIFFLQEPFKLFLFLLDSTFASYHFFFVLSRTILSIFKHLLYLFIVFRKLMHPFRSDLLSLADTFPFVNNFLLQFLTTFTYLLTTLP